MEIPGGQLSGEKHAQKRSIKQYILSTTLRQHLLTNLETRPRRAKGRGALRSGSRRARQFEVQQSPQEAYNIYAATNATRTVATAAVASTYKIKAATFSCTRVAMKLTNATIPSVIPCVFSSFHADMIADNIVLLYDAGGNKFHHAVFNVVRGGYKIYVTEWTQCKLIQQGKAYMERGGGILSR